MSAGGWGVGVKCFDQCQGMDTALYKHLGLCRFYVSCCAFHIISADVTYLKMRNVINMNEGSLRNSEYV